MSGLVWVSASLCATDRGVACRPGSNGKSLWARITEAGDTRGASHRAREHEISQFSLLDTWNKLPQPSMKTKKRKASAEALESSAHKPHHSSSAAEPLCSSSVFWRKICPDLHVGDSEFLRACHPLDLPASKLARLRAQLIADGFITLTPDELPWASSLEAMRKGVRRLTRRGWPASMLLVYDEAWAMAHQLSSLMQHVSGCANSLDTLAWSVTPALGQAGFAPHRDRQPPNVPRSFRPDGTPRYCTCWIALSHATPDNSCMHMVPRGYDPGYDAGDDHSPDAEDPLMRVFRSSDEAVQAVRACPLRAGGAVIFSHRTMHWGSKGASDCTKSRVSISFGHSDYAFEEPYFAAPHKQLPFPPVALRVALAAGQLINYHERFNFDLPLLRRLGATFRARKAAFSSGYAEKTAAEFMAACHDLQQRQATSRSSKQRQSSASSSRHERDVALEEPMDEEVANAALDDALDAMLDAQVSASGNLYDDFDDYCDRDSDDDDDAA